MSCFSCAVVVGGDINIQVHDVDDPDARRLHKLLESFEMTQRVNVATHDCGGTLDLVMTFAGFPLDEVGSTLLVSSPTMHSSATGHAATAEHLVCGWRPVDCD